MRMKSTIFHNLTWMTMQDLVLNIAGGIFFVVLARSIGESGLGLYSYLITVTSLFAYVLDFGIFTHYWRKWAADPAAFLTDLSDIYAVKLLLSVIFVVVMLVYVQFFEGAHQRLFFLATLFFLLETFRLIPIYYLMATNAFRSVCIANILDKIPAYALLVILMYGGISLENIFFWLIASKVISSVYLLSVVPFLLPQKLNLNRATYAVVFKQSLVLFLVQLISVLFFKVDTVMLKLLQPLSEVGLYTAVYRILETTIILPNILLSAFFAPIMQIGHSGGSKSQQVIIVALKYIFALSVSIALGIGIFSKQIVVLLYTESFLLASSSLQLLSLSIIPLFLNVPLLLFLLSKRKDTQLLVLSLVLLAINITLNYFLIPYYGAWGAALATLISELLHTVLLFKLTKITLSFSTILLVVCLLLVLIYIVNTLTLSLLIKVCLSLVLLVLIGYKLDLHNISEVKKLL